MQAGRQAGTCVQAIHTMQPNRQPQLKPFQAARAPHLLRDASQDGACILGCTALRASAATRTQQQLHHPILLLLFPATCQPPLLPVLLRN
jgi:hypothetical protein